MIQDALKKQLGLESAETVECREVQLNSGNVIDFMEREEVKKWEFDDVCRRLGALKNIIVVSPGSGLNQNEMKKLKEISQKFDIEVPKINFQNTYDLGCSNSQPKRLDAFLDAAHSDRKIIWATRGGFGTEMLLSDLTKFPASKSKKTFIGFCDSTSINIFLYQNWGWRVIHAPVLLYLLSDKFSKNKFDKLLDILEGRIDSYYVSPMAAFNSAAQAVKHTEISGLLTGGNLTLVESSLGTCWEVKTAGKILFLEDAHERAGSIYRSLYHLKDSGKLNNVKAIVFGTFLDAGSQEIVRAFLKRFASTLKDIPVFITNQIGHGHDNAPIIYGANATIVDGKMKIEVDHQYDVVKYEPVPKNQEKPVEQVKYSEKNPEKAISKAEETKNIDNDSANEISDNSTELTEVETKEESRGASQEESIDDDYSMEFGEEDRDNFEEDYENNTEKVIKKRLRT